MIEAAVLSGPRLENARPCEAGRLPFARSWLKQSRLPETWARFIDSRGDSMEPTINEGAICLVAIRFDSVKRDGVNVHVDGSNVRIKRFSIGWHGKVILISDNTRHASQTILAPHALQIADKVAWAGGKIRMEKIIQKRHSQRLPTFAIPTP